MSLGPLAAQFTVSLATLPLLVDALDGGRIV